MPEIRIPLYGMVQLSELEWKIVNSAPFQRLRRIRQLAFTDLVYPGATHTRFEHSIGVMHLATEAFQRICAKREVREVLQQRAYYRDEFSGALECVRRLLRLAALCHDLGHLPFSHAAESEVMERKENGTSYTHEDYSLAYVRMYLGELLDSDSENIYKISAEDVAGFLAGLTNTARLAALAPWRGLIDGELDVDKMDYLVRDSHHLGVEYGRFDVQRVLSTLTMIEDEDSGAIRIGVEQGGVLAVESLILARYYMFHQVYFHKVRRFLDLQYGVAFKKLLGSKRIDPPSSRENLEKHMRLDDWVMQAELADLAKKGCVEARRIIDRDCYKVIDEFTSPEEETRKTEAEEILRKEGISYISDDGAVKSTQEIDSSNIFVKGETSFRGELRPLGEISKVAKQIPSTIFIKRLYVSSEDRDRINKSKILQGVQGHGSAKGEK